MKVIKTASGKQILKISQKEWTNIGHQNKWINKKADAAKVDAYINEIQEKAEAQNPDYPYAYSAGVLQSILSTIVSDIETAARGGKIFSEASEKTGIEPILQMFSDLVNNNG
jgi:hypothetical protein